MDPSENPYASPLTPLVANKPRPFLYGLHYAAIGLLTISLIELLFFGLTITFLSTELIRTAINPLSGGVILGRRAVYLLVAMVCFARAVTVVAGAIAMRRNANHRRALVGAVASILGLACLPLPVALFVFGSQWLCAILIFMGIPFGIWALVILLRKDTRAAFAEAA